MLTDAESNPGYRPKKLDLTDEELRFSAEEVSKMRFETEQSTL